MILENHKHQSTQMGFYLQALDAFIFFLVSSSSSFSFCFLKSFFPALCVCVREEETEREGRRGELVDNNLRKCLFLYLNYAVLVVNIYYLSKLSVACNF